MKARTLFSVVTLLLTLVGAIPFVLADSTEASCVVHREGDINEESTGRCTFSQHQGYIDIDLKNGNTVRLSPGENKDHFKDKHGMKVVRSYAEGGVQEFKWDDRKITVTFGTSGAGTHGHQGNSGARVDSETPTELRDLVGARAGQAEQQVRERGYTYRNTETSGSTKYSNWRENSTGRCVLIRTEDGRYAAISYVTEIDCQKGQPEHGGDHGDAGWKTIGCVFAGNRQTCHVHTEFSQAGTGVQVKFPDGFVRKFVYDGGQFRSNDGMQWKSRLNAGLYHVSNDNKEEFQIPADWLR